MHIQQVRQLRKKVMGSDGQVRTVVEVEPVADAEKLVSHGKTYHSEGNGVFNVPEEIGAELVGGIFRDVSDPTGEFTRARIELANRNVVESAPRPVDEEVEVRTVAPEGVQVAVEDGQVAPNAAAPLPGAQAEPQPAKKARKRAPRKRAAAKK